MCFNIDDKLFKSKTWNGLTFHSYDRMVVRRRSQKVKPLRWRHNGNDVVSIHLPPICLLSRLVGLRSKKISKLRVTGLCAGNSPVTGVFPHKWPVTWKMFPFDDVIMQRAAVKWILTKRAWENFFSKSVEHIQAYRNGPVLCSIVWKAIRDSKADASALLIVSR